MAIFPRIAESSTGMDFLSSAPPLREPLVLIGHIIYATIG